MKVEFAPLNIPLHRRLETLALVTSVIMLQTVNFGIFVLWYLIQYTNYWLEALMYILWIFIIDVDICDKGGRRAEWARSLILWKYFKSYFPIHSHKTSNFELDPNRNYLFACFPHGVLSLSFFSVFLTNWGGFQELFPNHKPYFLTVKLNFLLPLLRDIFLSLGLVNASESCLNYLLSEPKGGNVAGLLVGGAAETFNAKPGLNKIILKKRKGFVKLALINGSPLVPVYSFGENDSYDQLDNPEGSLLRSCQEWIRGKTGIALPIIFGRGIFQYSFGILPRRRPRNVVFGEPIEVQRVQNPSQEQIDELQEKFMKRLVVLFDENKDKFVKDSEKARLIIT